jgi:ketosteroid isomerase-like protein
MIPALLLAAALSPFDQVVASERAFAAASLEKGLHESFLSYLAQDAIVFDPLPAPGRAAHEGKPPSKGKLSWGPAWVAVSSAGDLALSTGPWEFRLREDTGKEPRTGYFFSVWRRQPDGTWKVAVDIGVSSPFPFAIPQSVENGSAVAAAPAARPSDAANARIGVTTAERKLAAGAKSGLGTATAARIDPAVRVYRDGKAVAIGNDAARALLATDKRDVTCTPDRITAAASGDLGYAYGACKGEGSSEYGFLHVWRKQADGTWKIAVDVTP